MKDKKKHSILLALAEELSEKDFINYNPYEVIHNFWKKYRCIKNSLSLLDLFLSVKSFKNYDKLKNSEEEEFLHDFGMLMVATFAINFGEGEGTQQFFLSDNDAENFGFLIWLSFISKVKRMK